MPESDAAGDGLIRRITFFVAGVLASIAVLVVLGGTVLGTPEARATVLSACTWFTAHLVVVFLWLAWSRPREPIMPIYARVSALWFCVLALRLASEVALFPLVEAWALTSRLWFLLGCFELVVRVAYHRVPWVERALLVLAGFALLVPLAGAVDTELAVRIFDLQHFVLRALGLVVVAVLVRRLLQAPTRELLILLGSGLVIMGMGMDALWIRVFPDAVFSHLVTPVIGIAMALLLVSRLLEATRTARALAASLETKVQARTRELERRHADVRELERTRALQDERERLMRDMHDGAGGELVAALALLDGDGPDARSELRERLRAALLDLRLMIDSLDDLEGDLTGLLAGFRTRMQPVLDAAGLESRWRIDALPQMDNLGPRAALDVLRILQEALTNTLRHAEATTVEIRAVAVGDRVHLEVEDDGRGFDASDHAPGRGLTNMRVRAERLGGSFEVERTERGTRVRIALPLGTR